MSYYVYRFMDDKDQVIYVGRTKDINHRLVQHFGEYGHLPKECYDAVDRVEFLTFEHRADMIIKELQYISQYKPVFNTLDVGDCSLTIDSKYDEWVEYVGRVERVEGFYSKDPVAYVVRDASGINKLNNKDKGYLLMLYAHMGYDGMLKATNRSSLPMDRKQMQEVLGIKSNKTLVELIKRLKDIGALKGKAFYKKDKKYKAFYISREYAYRSGAGKDGKAVKLYIDSFIEVYNQEGQSIAGMGLIYDAILHLHKHSNYLVKDVNKRLIADDDYINHADICEIHNLNKRSMLDRMDGLTYNGADIFETEGTEINSRIIAKYKVNNKILESV